MELMVAVELLLVQGMAFDAGISEQGGAERPASEPCDAPPRAAQGTRIDHAVRKHERRAPAQQVDFAHQREPPGGEARDEPLVPVDPAPALKHDPDAERRTARLNAVRERSPVGEPGSKFGSGIRWPARPPVVAKRGFHGTMVFEFAAIIADARGL